MMWFVYAEYLVGSLLRYLLVKSEVGRNVVDRAEISTPLNSWKRIVEGIHLYNEGNDPYDGDLLHEFPLSLHVYGYIMAFGSLLPLIFIICDVCAAHFLFLTAKKYMTDRLDKQNKKLDTFSKDAGHILLKNEVVELVPVYVVTAYMFNPYTVFNCVGLTTTVFGNLIMAILFYGIAKGNTILSVITLPVIATQTVYPAMLIVPVLLRSASSLRMRAAIMIVFILIIACLLWSSKVLSGSWAYVENVYVFMFNVSDLKPNVGVFWYFFTEMFEHFRSLFLYAFQINATILYLVPLSLRFRKDPVLLSYSIVSLITVFKPYPCIGDVGFVLSILPMWSHFFGHMRQRFIIGSTFLITTALAPTVWHLWLYSRSANANFYFGVTLAFAVAQIFLVTDVLFAYVKREFSLKCGISRKIDGKLAKLILE